MREKLLTTREASKLLGISEQKVIELSEKKGIEHFKLAGEFLRFRKEDILRVKPGVQKKYDVSDKKNRFWENLREFVYFNDFYILGILIISVLLFIIIKDFVIF